MKIKFVFTCLFVCFCAANIQGQDQFWPQFRGINGSGVAAETALPPVSLAADNLHWSIALPRGVSSPVIWEDKLFLTGFIDSTRELQTICIDRVRGKILWKSSVIPDTVENVHPIGSPAQGTVVTDGEKVVAYFGSCGLVCYDMEGNRLWKYKLACNNNMFGSGTSPVISGEKLIFFSDVDPRRFLLVLDKHTGKLIWKKELEYPKVGDVPVGNTGGHSVPQIYNNMIVVLRIGGVTCYSLNDGTKIFDYKMFTSGTGIPLITKNKIIAATWYNLSEENQRGKLPDFDQIIENYDSNRNNAINAEEFTNDIWIYLRPDNDLYASSLSVKQMFWAFDTTKDLEITRQEWEAGIELIKSLYKPAGLISVSLDNEGELSDSCVLWRVPDNIPEVPSPILYQNRVYMIKDGGVLTSVDSESGKVIYTTKIGNPGPSIASPVAANGYLYLISYNGKMKVVKASDTFEVAAEYDFKDKVAATPAIVGNTIYVRTGRNILAYSNE